MRYLNTIWELNASDIYTLIYIVSYIVLAMCGRWFAEMANLPYEQLTRSDSEQTTALLNDNPIKIKCHKYREFFIRWIDDKALRCSLIRNDQCIRVNREHYRYYPSYYPEPNYFGHTARKKFVEDLWTYFSSRGDEKGSGYEELIGCLEYSLKEISFVHLGHSSLLELLTSDSDERFLGSDKFRRNEAIQHIVHSDINWFIILTNVTELEPYMLKENLLTCYDKEVLETKTDSDKAYYLLTELLDAKGHCGYIIFFDCLKDSVKGKHYHAGHLDIIKQIESGLKSKGFHIRKYTDNEVVLL